MQSSNRAETDRVRRYYDRTAGNYDRVMRCWDRLLFRGGREWACGQAHARVLELVGAPAATRPYPGDVSLVAIDPSDAMLAIARRRAHALGRTVELHLGDAQALAFADASFDTVISTLTLCTVPDEGRAISEAWRVLRPEGRFILLEHVRSPNRVVSAAQRLLDPISVRLAGDHLLREPLDQLRTAGFTIERHERSRAGIVERLLARKPTA
jgi:ubiquinone/menaquinone biosynthesis C-methylase UbiE